MKKEGDYIGIVLLILILVGAFVVSGTVKPFIIEPKPCTMDVITGVVAVPENGWNGRTHIIRTEGGIETHWSRWEIPQRGQRICVNRWDLSYP